MIPPSEMARLSEAIDTLTFNASRFERDRSMIAPPPEFRALLAAVDGSEASRHVVAWVAEISRLLGATVTLVSVVTPDPGLTPFDGMPGAAAPISPKASAEMVEAAEARGRAALEQAAAALAAKGVLSDRVLAIGTSAVEEISRVARERGADLVVLGSHGYGVMQRMFLGSVADGVKNHVEASVLIARTPTPPSGILAPVDGSRLSKRASAVAARLARAWRARMTLVHALPEATYAGLKAPPASEPKVALFDGALPIEARATDGPPAARIAQMARDGPFELIVMGSRGLSGFASLVAGSVSNRVSHETGASVLLVKERGTASRAPEP